jgi:hypothetical protein
MMSLFKAPVCTARWLLLGLALVLSIAGCSAAPASYSQAIQTTVSPGVTDTTTASNDGQQPATVTVTATPSTDAQPPATLTALIVSASSPSVRAEVNQPATATATCSAGEQVIASSFVADIFEADGITASYPSAANAWTVIASSPASFIILSVQAYCVPASFPLGIKIVQGTGKVTCPSGSVLVNGGFQGGADTSKPDGNDWTSDGATTYALCATQHLAAGSAVSAPEQLPPGFGVSGGGTAACPQDQVATGGGFSGGQYSPSFFGPDKNFSGWAIGASANNFSSPQPAPLVWAVCTSVR